MGPQASSWASDPGTPRRHLLSVRLRSVLGLSHQALLSLVPHSRQRACLRELQRRGPRAPEGALPGGAAVTALGARVPRGRGPAQPRQYLLP